MRVLIAPNSFGESLTAAAAADAIAAGWRTAAPTDTFDLAPLSEGGPGSLEVLAGPELGRVDEEAHHDQVALGAGGAQQ